MSRKRRKKNNKEPECRRDISTKDFKIEFVKVLTVNPPSVGMFKGYDWDNYFEHGVDLETVFYNTKRGKDKEFLEKSFTEKTDEEKVEYVENFVYFHYDWSLRFLSGILEMIKYQSLKRFYLSFIGKKIGRKVPSKDTMAKSLAMKFVGKEEPEILKRDEEEKNIKSADLQDIRSIEMCDILVPSEVIVHIFSFLEYDRNILPTYGKISKCFYITILSTWPKIRVSKKNVFKISILVYNSVREIKIDEGKERGYFQANLGTVIQSEFSHVCSQLNENRLRKATFKCTFREFHAKLSFIEKFMKKKNNKNPFRNVTDLVYELTNDSNSQTYLWLVKMDDSFWKVKLSKIFPSLRRFENPVKFYMLKDSNISEIRLKHHCYGNGYSQSTTCPLHVRFMQYLNHEYTIDKFRRSVTDSSKIRRLDVDIDLGKKKSVEFLSDMLRYLKQLDRVKLDIASYRSLFRRNENHDIVTVDLSESLQHLSSTTTELSIATKCYSDYSGSFIVEKLKTSFFRSRQNVLPSIQKLEISTQCLVDTSGVIGILRDWKNLKHLHVKYQLCDHEKPKIQELFRLVSSEGEIIPPYILLEITETSLMKKKKRSLEARNTKDEDCAIFERNLDLKDIWFGWSSPGSVSEVIIENMPSLLSSFERFSWVCRNTNTEEVQFERKKIREIFTEEDFDIFEQPKCYPRFQSFKSILKTSQQKMNDGISFYLTMMMDKDDDELNHTSFGLERFLKKCRI